MTLQRTFAMIKPDATQRGLTGAILAMADGAGLHLVVARRLTLDRATAEALYADHVSQPWFNDQIDYMTSAPVVAVILEGVEAVAAWRHLMGPTDREKAAQGTIRRQYAESLRRNSVHGSESLASAEREAAIFFPNGDING